MLWRGCSWRLTSCSRTCLPFGTALHNIHPFSPWASWKMLYWSPEYFLLLFSLAVLWVLICTSNWPLQTGGVVTETLPTCQVCAEQGAWAPQWVAVCDWNHVLVDSVNKLVHCKHQLFSVFDFLDNINLDSICYCRNIQQKQCVYVEVLTLVSLKYIWIIFVCLTNIYTRPIKRFFFFLHLWMLSFSASGQCDCDTVIKINTCCEEKSCWFYIFLWFHPF